MNFNFAKNILQHPKYLLAVIGIVQIIGLFFFISEEVEVLLPKGNDPVLDWIYNHTFFIQFFYYLFTGIVIISVFLLEQSKKNIFFLTIFISFSVLFQQTWLLLFVYPFLLTEAKKNEDYDSYSINFFDILGISIVLAGSMLMLVQTGFPHTSGRAIFYFTSISSIFFLFFSIFFFPIYLFFSFILKKINISNIFQIKSHYFLLLLFVFLPILFYAYQNFDMLIQQFYWYFLPYGFAGIITNILLLFIGQINYKSSTSNFLHFIHSNLTKNGFWWKFILTLLIFRQIFSSLIHSDQNFLVTFGYDYIHILFPPIAFLFSIGMVYKIFSLTSKKIARITSLLLILIVLIPIPFIYQKDWTLILDNNRPFALYISKQSRKILLSLGIDIQRVSDKYIEIINEEIAHKQRQGITLTDVFRKSNTLSKYKYDGIKPNIFVFVSDTTMSSHLSVYGYNKNTTPNLIRFSKEATLFKNFYSASTATFQDIASIFTGNYIGNYPHLYFPKRDTLCSFLDKQEYKQLFAKTFLSGSFSSEREECDKFASLSYEGDDESSWEKIDESFKNNPKKPHFIYMHVIGGHKQWTGKNTKTRFGNREIDHFDNFLYEMDAQFQRFLDNLKKRNLYNNSIIIFTADHGVGLGLHNNKVSFDTLYQDNIKIPFIIKVPKSTTKIVENYYSLIDIRPSLEEILGEKNVYKKNIMEFHL